MAGVQTKGLTETMKMLEAIEADTDEIVEAALKEGIGVVTDEMRREIFALKTSNDYRAGDGMRYPPKADIDGLLDSLGYTPVQLRDSKFDVKSGFDGYNSRKSKKYPGGHPNQMIANAINKGTSFMPAQPFINRAKNAAQKAAIDAIQKEIDKSISKLSK